MSRFNPAPQGITETVSELLADPANGWSIGTYGAIAEFLRSGTERVLSENLSPNKGPLAVVLDQGAIRLELSEDVIPVAYETLSRKPDRWSQGVAFCLDQTRATMSRRSKLTELGPDSGAILDQDRSAVLFDMGLDVPHVDVCIRTDDSNLINILRGHCGESLLSEDSAAMNAVVPHSPQRVFVSRLGRVEIYQGIGQTKTPQGPHTHVLPKLLAVGKTHADDTPIPQGLYPCLTLHPASPLADWLGEPKVFEPEQYRRFQKLLAAWGNSEYVAEHRRAARALANGVEPRAYRAPKKQLGMSALRIVLRQQHHLQGTNPLLQRWRTEFDEGRPLKT